MKVVIAGANGFLGTALAQFLKEKNHEVIGLVRHNETTNDYKTVLWDGETIDEWFQELNGADAVINLAGKSVNCRYNERNKKLILHSRLNATKVLAEAINLVYEKPKLWMNAASATIYEHSENIPNTEQKNKIGHGFSVEVCQQWERTFFDAEVGNVRKVGLRTAIVLARNKSVMIPYENLARFGLGGKMGNGLQMMSWIHIQDFCEAILFMIEQPQISGVVNLSAPNPITNQTFMSKVRKLVHCKIGMPAKEWMLKIGAWLLGTEAELVLKSRYVLPEKLLKAGYTFKVPNMDECFHEFAEKKR